MRTRLVILLATLAALLCAAAGEKAGELKAEYDARGAERSVAALPGVGAGWLDTLRRVAGAAEVDTINAAEIGFYGNSLIGLHEPFHHIVSIRTDMRAYAFFIRGNPCGNDDELGYYVHPSTIASPAAAVAHEFGHHFGFMNGYGPSEEFADRFSRAMIALRGWDVPDPKDAALNHRVRFLLLKSYWPKEN